MPWRTVFFAVNASMAVVIAVGGAVMSVRGDPSPFALVGAFALVWPVIGFAVLEALLFFGNQEDLEWPLGALCGALGFFALLLLMVVVTSAVADGLDWDAVVAGGGLLGMGSYALWCGRWRTRRRHDHTPRGFPVLPVRENSVETQRRVNTVDPSL